MIKGTYQHLLRFPTSQDQREKLRLGNEVEDYLLPAIIHAEEPTFLEGIYTKGGAIGIERIERKFLFGNVHHTFQC